MDKIFLPMTKVIFAKTISSDLVNVQPMGGSNPEIEAAVKQENRQRKIDNLLNDTKFKEMKINEHPDYLKLNPKSELFYFDYRYDDQSEI